MREIKFRAYHIPTKRMFDVFSWCKDCVFEYSMDGVGTLPTLPAEMKDCELMQFTGLKDKNGKEIYEGDIVVFSENSKIHVVKYVNTGFVLTASNGNIMVYNFNPNVFKVIGNIHENPELL